LICCQYPVKQSDYPDVLEYNSYIDCSEIFEIGKEKIKKKGIVKGHLTEQDRELIINFLKETEVISVKEKKGMVYRRSGQM
jgi:predicted rRNA methylase YqxC with S4 and FtsJ domains